jgi:hypothetical protein
MNENTTHLGEWCQKKAIREASESELRTHHLAHGGLPEAHLVLKDKRLHAPGHVIGHAREHLDGQKRAYDGEDADAAPGP